MSTFTILESTLCFPCVLTEGSAHFICSFPEKEAGMPVDSLRRAAPAFIRSMTREPTVIQAHLCLKCSRRHSRLQILWHCSLLAFLYTLSIQAAMQIHTMSGTTRAKLTEDFAMIDILWCCLSRLSFIHTSCKADAHIQCPLIPLTLQMHTVMPDLTMISCGCSLPRLSYPYTYKLLCWYPPSLFLYHWLKEGSIDIASWWMSYSQIPSFIKQLSAHCWEQESVWMVGWAHSGIGWTRLGGWDL